MLILVMGVLVMLLLIGTAMLITTRNESGRIASERIMNQTDARIDRVVDNVLEILRKDLWGTDNILLNYNRTHDGNQRVIDEPFDGFNDLGEISRTASTSGGFGQAFWVGDEWLASTVPYFDASDNRLKWRRMSWAPLNEDDALNGQGLPGRLGNGNGGAGIPGQHASNVVIPVVDDNDGADLAAFKVKYLDADGDGIRDALRLSNQFADPNLDLGIRIVDHSSMINLNTCYDRDALEIGGAFPLRGHNVTDIMIDPLIPLSGEGGEGLGFRSRASAFAAIPPAQTGNPDWYAALIVRGDLLIPSSIPFYPPSDSEAALRNRNLLVPFRSYFDLYSAGTDTATRVERDFRDTLSSSVADALATHYSRLNEEEPASNGHDGFPFWMHRMSPVNLVNPAEPSAEFVRRPLLTTLSKDHLRIRVPASVATGRVALPPGMRLPMIFNEPVNFATAFFNPANPERIGRDIVHPETGEIIPAAARFDLVDLNAHPRGMAYGQDLDADGTPGTLSDDLMAYASQLAGAMWLVLEGDPSVTGEDFNADGVLTPLVDEDLNGNGNLDLGEDLNRNGLLDSGISEDLNGNGVLDPGDEVMRFQGVPLTPVGRIRMAWQFAANVIDYRDADLDPLALPISLTGLTQPVYGVEPQPFITELYALVAQKSSGGAPDYDNSLYAVEIYNPFPIDIPLKDFRLKTGRVDQAGQALVDFVEPNGKSSVLRSGKYLVVQKGGVALAAAAAALQKNTFEIDDNDRYVSLVRLVSGKRVEVDRVTPANAEFAEPGRPAMRSQRDPRRWMATVGVQGEFAGNSLNLGVANDNFAAGGDTSLSPWVFGWSDLDGDGKPDAGFGLARPWAFTSVAELTNVFLVGPDPAEPTFPSNESPVFGQATVPALVATMQTDPSVTALGSALRMAAGRPIFAALDNVEQVFVDPRRRTINDAKEPWTNRLFDFFTVGSAGADGIDLNGNGWIDPEEAIDFNGDGDFTDPGEQFDVDGSGTIVNPGEWLDNDGDGRLNEPTENYDVNRTAVGRLNINTAPELVLRSLRYLYTFETLWEDPDERPAAELAQTLVAFREGRPVGPLAPPDSGMRPFRSVAELMQITQKWTERQNSTGRGVPLRLKDQWEYYATDGADLGVLPKFNDGDGDRFLGDGLADDFRKRDAIFNRVANLLTVRSDVYTIYIVLVDNKGTGDPNDDQYLRRVQLTVDRTNCYRSPKNKPEIVARQDGSYYDVTR